MKKPWIIFSVAIVTAIFIYSLSLISKQNQCTWVRSYLCTPSQQLSTQTAVTPLPQVRPSTSVPQKNTTKSDITAQQAAAQLAQQQADAARLAQQQAAQLAQQQANAQAAQQAAASSVNTRTRAS